MWRNVFSLKPTIRFSLVALVVACIVPVASIEILIALQAFQASRTELLDDTLDHARAMTAALDLQMIESEGALRALGTSPSLLTGDFERFYDQAKQIQAQQRADSLALIDANGQEIFNTLRPFDAQTPDTNGAGRVQMVTDQALPVTGLIAGRGNRQSYYAVVVPMRLEGGQSKTLEIGMFPDRAAEILPTVPSLVGQTAGIVDRNGTLIARSVKTPNLVGQILPSSIRHQMALGDEGHFVITSAEGDPAIFLYSRSAYSQWVTYLTIPEAFLTQRLWESLKWLIVMPILMAAMAIPFVWFFGGLIARSITGLTVPARALGHGRQIDIGPLFLKEADDVARAIVEASNVLVAAQYDAQHDKLTKLANRALFADLVEHEWQLSSRLKMSMTILYIDLDGFKAINDTHGHAAGDDLLGAVAKRLVSRVRAADVVARLGGDEFAIMLSNTSSTAAQGVADKLVKAISAPFKFGELQLSSSASIGIASFPESASCPTELLKAADAAMYIAKRSGKGRYIVADPLHTSATML